MLTEALRQVPYSSSAKILVRIDGAGATHDLLEHLQGLNTTRRSAKHLKKLTLFERKPGWRYQIAATNIGRTWGIAGSHQPQWLDVLHRAHAGIEDRVRTNKAMGLRKLPSSAWTTNCGWVLAANLAADLDAWTRLLGLHDHWKSAGVWQRQPLTVGRRVRFNGS